MAQVTIEVEGLSKRYEVPGAGGGRPLSGGRLTTALKRHVPLLRRDDERNWFWALRDATFKVQRGDVLGIIGRNGAGKSTLLKVLAGIVAPSAGRAMLLGRVGSLLEVGTGFHPDLTGRDNVVLSAALLGISKREVLRRFDQIVEHAGVGSFIDVPVKRYSSGMYMRLAYSVAALLESDILLLDEVLAVGDADFQKRTKRNVDTIAHDGRTVLFVSHSMASINELCTRCIWLDKGHIIADGSPEEITDLYLTTFKNAGAAGAVDLAAASPHVELSAHHGYHTVAREQPLIRWVETLKGDGTPARVFQTGEPMRVRIGLAPQPRGGHLAVAFHTMDDRRITVAHSHGLSGIADLPAPGVVECVIPEIRMTSGDYALVLEATTADGTATVLDSVSNATQIRVELGAYLNYPGLLRNQGHLAQRTQWEDRPALELLR